MAGMLGVLISNLLSNGASFLTEIRDSISTPSSSSSSSSSNHQSKLHAIEEDMEALMRMLKRIEATLHDAETREITDKSVQLWLTELRDLAYAADDVLDEWSYEKSKAQVEARNASKGNPNKRKLIEIPEGLADQIKNIQCRFHEISEQRQALQLREEDGVRIYTSPSYPTSTSHLVIESSIFGRETEKEEIISCLTSDCCQKNITVFPIVGMGGLGKTTLAQLVYNDKRVRQQFDKLGWICVSDDFNVIRITKEILESLSCRCDQTTLSTLQEELKSVVAGKRVFVVLDDVWNEQQSHWERLMTPFISAENVIILVTTRNESVALTAQTVPFFKLSVMPNEQCWQLFQYYAFGGSPTVEHLNLPELGRKFVSKCNGLPLAIKTIASLLRCEMEEERWLEILQSEIWEEYANSEIFAALRISYMRLPEYLKSCLLFCSTFPKDYCYEPTELINLWCAHDYVMSRRMKTVEDIGWEYVKELKQRSFFEENLSGFYKIHDLVHDLLCLISKKTYRELHDDSLKNIKDEVFHHLFFNGNLDLLVQHVLPQQLAVLRTLIMSTQCLPTKGSYLSNAQRLRVLKLSFCDSFLFDWKGQFKHMRHLELDSYYGDLKPIWQLLNLRYLSLKHSRLNKLPKEITNLANLKYFSLSHCEIEVLPGYFFSLSNLENLCLESCNLKVLPESLGKLVNLRELHIKSCPSQAFPDSLCELRKLRRLEFRTTEWERQPTKLPEAIGNLSSLREVCIAAHINHLPHSFNKIYNYCRSIKLVHVVNGKNSGIGWLKNFESIKGALCLENLSSLIKVDGLLPLVAMHNLEELAIGWFDDIWQTIECKNRLYVSVEWTYTKHSEEMAFLILDSLQPHPNLKRFVLCDYPGKMFPMWMGDRLVCASLQTIDIRGSKNVNYLPFGNLCSLKTFVLGFCDSLSSFPEDSLPYQLEKLDIYANDRLVSMPVLLKLANLVELSINCCFSLHPSLVGSDHEANWLPPASCNVDIVGCPQLKDWCIQHDIAYGGELFSCNVFPSSFDFSIFTLKNYLFFFPSSVRPKFSMLISLKYIEMIKKMEKLALK